MVSNVLGWTLLTVLLVGPFVIALWLSRRRWRDAAIQERWRGAEDRVKNRARTILDEEQARSDGDAANEFEENFGDEQ